MLVSKESGGSAVLTHRTSTFAVLVALSVVVTVAPDGATAAASGEHGYRTGGELVPSDEKQCAGVPNCLSATLPPTTVPGKGQAQSRFACPPTHPHIWGWDSAQHEQIFVSLVAVDPWTLTIKGVNATDVPGEFAVSLGCSDQPDAGALMQKSRQLAPTAHMAHRRAARASRGNAQRRDTSTVGDSDACAGVPQCQPSAPATFSLGGWATIAVSYQCQNPYPFAWNFSYSQTGSPSVSAIGAIFEVNPGTFDILLTNWNPFATDEVTIIVGCSQFNSFSGNSCNAPGADPGCPVVPGSSHTYCSNRTVPVCFSTYQERCTSNNLLYQCTIDVLPVPWCQPCPGQ
jgi:hypothetical protein